MKKVTSLQGLQVEGENARENGKYVPLSPESGILLKQVKRSAGRCTPLWHRCLFVHIEMLLSSIFMKHKTRKYN